MSNSLKLLKNILDIAEVDLSPNHLVVLKALRSLQDLMEKEATQQPVTEILAALKEDRTLLKALLGPPPQTAVEASTSQKERLDKYACAALASLAGSHYISDKAAEKAWEIAYEMEKRRRS